MMNAAIIRASITQLEMVSSIVLQLNNEDYTKPISNLKSVSIGKHIRHILEFYECLIKQSAENFVQYDSRKRNLLIEEDKYYTLDFIKALIEKLSDLPMNKNIRFITSINNQKVDVQTTLYRELAYNIEHTVHHFAMLSIIIPIHFPTIHLPENFGYADSTIQYDLSKSKTNN